MEINNKIYNNLESNIDIQKKQNNFLESTLGKVINTGINFGLRALLPDLIENQVIEIKDTLLKEGLKEGIDKAITSAIDLGKSTVGIVTGNFESVSQAQAAIQKGGIIDGISDAMDFVLDKTQKTGKIPDTVIYTIKNGKNTLLNSVSNNIEHEFNSQLQSIEKLNKYSNNWKDYFNNKNFEGMTKEIYKINSEIKKILPMEKIINEARTIQNLHELVKNKGKNFDLTNEEIELTRLLK